MCNFDLFRRIDGLGYKQDALGFQGRYFRFNPPGDVFAYIVNR